MFEEFMGLPMHPLLVHAPVVLVPLLALAGVGYAVLPPLRPRLDWALALLALVAPGGVWVARQSGEAFRDRLAKRDMMPPELAEQVAAHEALACTLWWLTLALGAVALAMVLADKLVGRRAAVSIGGPTEIDEDHAAATAQPRKGGALRLVVLLLLGVALIVLAGAAGWYVYQTGHTGSEMVWEGL